MSTEKETHTHPSFGQISFSRTQCSGGVKFYGSELDQDHYIQMEVNPSEVSRDLTKEWYFAKSHKTIKVRMTSNQFAELLTSLNHGSGVPCTVEVVDGKQVADIPFQESRKEFIHRKFQDRMTDFAKSIRDKQNQAKAIVKKKTLSKQDVHDLGYHIEWLTQEVERNIPFFMECFQETMDEVVNDAKAEIENAIQLKVTTLGLAALHEQNKLLK